ncbi:homoserine kinase [Evansella clarkii]|uniref:homoserine kinase n=1 Tax=Evansella clarkii TaxID=79879 RepID=UPI000B432C48|nr:homoserine kinase [Evansella clarkii]
MKFTITVPASTANMGPGFDSVGMALNRYIKIQVSPASEWSITFSSRENLDGLPANKDNLIYQTAASVASDYGRTLPPCELIIKSEIPLSRGMGSSAAAIVAGIELANVLLDLKLDAGEKLRRASVTEGHPDNVAASLYGGLVIGSHRADATDVISGGVPEVDIVAVIPPYELMTKDSRNSLPEQFTFPEAVAASSISNVLVAALLQNNWPLAGKMMGNDLFHQNYRKRLVPELDQISTVVEGKEVYGVSLSGAGPTVLCFAPVGSGQVVLDTLQEAGAFSGHEVVLLKVSEEGVQVEYE